MLSQSANKSNIDIPNAADLSIVTAEKRIRDGYNPIPLSKNDGLSSPQKKDDPNDMKLVQQYVMIRGRLQPALKYLAQNPMFNRYQLK